jgi:RHS repeat-associated protein
LLRERIASVTDLRGKTTSYHYDPFTATNPDIGPRIFLTRIDDPRTNHPVTLTYTDTVYGDWGVASLTDAVNSTWRFKFCAENSGNPCGTLDKTIGFRSDVTAPAPFTASGFSAHFDTAGRYTGKTDGRQNTSVVTPYPTANLLSTNYGLAGLKAASQTARNNQTHHAYTPEGNEQSRTQADSGVLKKTWVKAAAANLYKLTASTSPAGVLRTMDYDATGKLTSHRVASLPASTQSYDPVTQLLKQSTDPLGNPTAYTYDAQGNLLTSTDALNQVTQHQYDSQGRVTRSIDPAGVITETSYDNAGNVLKETVDPSGLNLQTQYQYDENGNQTKHTDPLGNVTTTVYDAANRVQSVTRLVGGVAVTTRNAYDALGRVSSVTNANGHTSTTTFDDAGNVSTRSDALPRTTRYTYDEDNRVATVTDPEGRVTSTDYDPMGRVSKITTPDGSVSSTYDLDGRLATQTDKRGLVTSYEYDAAGRKNKVTDPKGGVTRMTYYDDGSLKTVADPNGNATTYEVDALGRRTRLLDAKGRAWTTSYDPAGNVKTTSDPAGNSATRSYDTANRLKSIAWSDGTFVNYTLDKNGNHTQVVDNTGTTTYVYDEMDRIKSATNPNGQTVSYAYDGLGNVTTLGYPGGRNVGYRYDVVERMAGLTDWGGRSTNYTLDKSDRVTQIAHGNGATTGMSYDPAGRLQSLTSRKPDNSVLAAHTLTRDANGNITKNDVQLPLEPSFVSGNRALAVDTDNRQTALSYDAAGRVTNNGSFALGWNARDQLISIGSDSQTYNAEGVRVAQTAGGAVTRFVMDTNSSLPNLLAETDAANAVQRYYLHSPYGLVEQIDAAGNPRFYHFDPSGNTLALTNAAGQVSDAYAYTPFGETTANGATVNPFRFVGQYGVRNFNGTPLHDMRARWYAADRARFMSLDPLLGDAERPQSLNRYAYVEGNPVVRIDASGLSPTTITYDSFQIYLENEPSNFFKRWIYWYGVRKNLKASEEELSSAMKKFLDSRDLVDLMLMWLMTSNKPPQTFLPRTILKSIDKIKGKKATDDDKKKYFNKGISVYLDPQVQGAEGNCTDSSFAENFSDICARYK